jgi:anti-anti-sigma factor
MVHADAFTASSASGDRTRWITLTGELDMATAPVLGAEFDRSGNSRSRALVLDLSGLTFMDCTALRAIVNFARRARAGGWRLRIVSPGPLVARIFVLTKTAAILPLTGPTGGTKSHY